MLCVVFCLFCSEIKVLKIKKMQVFYTHTKKNKIKLSFCLCPAASGILVPQPGIETSPPVVGALSLNHWTPREVPAIKYFKIKICIFLDIMLLHTIDYNVV
ncbi:unnamed protein product [Rangifer tarandus platyrhynchus]|uniref:Secreted protein n=1 Tax=Rangifer tarandus platyrhynchus TaxID=3082113 RepID=A0ABN8XYY8_RANTA|nr:unnamed protein product [Rangifer tarandus platyrhynchus]